MAAASQLSYFRLSNTYQRCLSKCPQSPAKRILLRGQKAWNIICADFRNNSDFHSQIVPCWATSGSTLTKSCTPMAQTLQAEIVQLMEGGVENLGEGMDALCRSVHSYDTCFVMKNYEICGLTAAKFLIKLTHQTSHAFVELLDEVLSLKNLPRSCLDWLSHKYASVSSPRAIAKRMKFVSRNTATVLLLAIVFIRMLILH
ncbi:hypothetical protein OESDEN_04287 [Oesophagostomum dentatum]|uniref:Uncharacterized protein n=1 Tax=Oesophagostomum dentatum TaxID=61180 RepID=A0A0B1S763_OESDE|nr:hypothetical protein OESDEN_20619 [Oesophagostomum dentatum]KHJ95762.1 hypothetical protein OESDEN_04287 [Oesophagostomum dentatum]